MGLLSEHGRPAREVVYEELCFMGKDYIIGNVTSCGNHYKFVIDKEDYDKVSKYSWHITSNLDLIEFANATYFIHFAGYFDYEGAEKLSRSIHPASGPMPQ